MFVVCFSCQQAALTSHATQMLTLVLMLMLCQQHSHATMVRQVNAKKEQLQELLVQQIALKKLVELNQSRAEAVTPEARIQLPFILVSTSEETTIQLEMDTPQRYQTTPAPAPSCTKHFEWTARNNTHACPCTHAHTPHTLQT